MQNGSWCKWSHHDLWQLCADSAALGVEALGGTFAKRSPKQLSQQLRKRHLKFQEGLFVAWCL